MKWRRNFDVINKQATVNAAIASKAYIDGQDTATLAAGSTFAVAQDALTLTSAKAYTNTLVVPPGLVAALPAAPPGNARGFVTDATQTLAAGLGNAVVGGGANSTPVYWDSVSLSWKIG